MASIAIRNLTFTYPLAENPALQGVTLDVEQSEFIVICGKSGCGKSTLLRQLKKNLIPYGDKEGSILYGNVAIEDLPDRQSTTDIGFVQQNPDNQLVTDKVWHELAFGLESLGMDNQTIRRKVAEMASFFDMQTWFRKSVSELSGGEQQRLALGKILLLEPKILLLDEPTKGLDPFFKITLSGIFKKLKEQGVTLFMVSHDVEFCAEYGDRCAMFFDGDVVSVGPARPFFAGNSFYTTTANRIVRQWNENLVTWEEVAVWAEQNTIR